MWGKDNGMSNVLYQTVISRQGGGAGMQGAGVLGAGVRGWELSAG